MKVQEKAWKTYYLLSYQGNRLCSYRGVLLGLLAGILKKTNLGQCVVLLLLLLLLLLLECVCVCVVCVCVLSFMLFF